MWRVVSFALLLLLVDCSSKQVGDEDRCHSEILGSVCLEKFGTFSVKYGLIDENYYAEIRSPVTDEELMVFEQNQSQYSCLVEHNQLLVSHGTSRLRFEFMDNFNLASLPLVFPGITFKDGSNIFENCDLVHRAR